MAHSLRQIAAQKGQNAEALVAQQEEYAGAYVFRPPRQKFYTRDVFNAFDILSYNPHTGTLKLIQVTASKLPGAQNKRRAILEKFPIKHVIVELIKPGQAGRLEPELIHYL